MNGRRSKAAALADAAKRRWSELTGQTARFQGRLDDLTVTASGLEFHPGGRGQVNYYWFEIKEQRGAGRPWTGVRVVKLAELVYLPQEMRLEASLIRRQAALQRALAATGIELITLSLGIFEAPEGQRLSGATGVVQCYGVATRAASREAAAALAGQQMAAVTAAFAAQFPQSRLVPLSAERAVWLANALGDMAHITTLIGQPDPRESARGGGQERAPKPDTFTEQQNELLFRALTRAREEFVFLNIATPVARADVARMQAALADLTSPIASRQQGSSSIGFGVSLPVILSAAQGLSAGQSYGTASTTGETHGTSQAHGTATTDGVANTASWSHTIGQAHTEGVAHSSSITHTSGTSHSVGISEGAAQSSGWADTAGASQSHGVTNTSSHSESASGGSVTTVTSSQTQGHTDNWTANGGVSIEPAGIGISGGGGVGASDSVGQSTGISQATSSGWASTNSSGQSISDVATTSQAHSVSGSATQSQGISESWGSSSSVSVGEATTLSQADTTSESQTVGGARTTSHAETSSYSTGESQAQSQGRSVALGQTLGAVHSASLGAGVAPSASVSKSFQWKDENAVALTELLEQQINLLKEAAEEGGLYSDAYLLTRTETGRAVAEAAAVQAFGGSQGVVMHVQPRRPAGQPEAEHLQRHARCFSPSSLVETLGWLNGYAFSTLITPTQQAAYSAPGLFEEGSALTVQERTPPFALNPALPGDVVLGFQYSTERGELTTIPLRLSEDRHFHTVFAADTGFGKTVAGERLAVEVVGVWHHRAVALDFGAGWRKLLRSTLPRDRVDFYQLYPGGVRPFRWNFLQIGRRIDPETQISATAELLCAAGRMGPRQMGLIKKALRHAYLQAGVIFPAGRFDLASFEKKPDPPPSKPTGRPTKPQPQPDPATELLKWTVLQPGEPQALAAARIAYGRSGPVIKDGVPVSGLGAFDRQSLAVWRSRSVGIADIYEWLLTYTEGLDERDPSRVTLEGILVRLETFTRGALGQMYGPGDDSLAVEDLGLLGPEPKVADRWGLCILEAGTMDEFAKIVVFSLAAWHLYQDAVARRREALGGWQNRPLDIFWEEANKVLTGDGAGADAATSSSGGAIQLWQSMWRDGRKYSIYLHPLVQTLAALPPGILASCNNAFFGQMKNLQDRDLAVGHLARSERGFTDEEYKRYVSRIPKKLAIVKLGYSDDVAQLEPMLAQPLIVPGVEPSDEELTLL
ncbi:MAG: serine-rich protein [Anaerolineales bacterium]|nr:serine-rich protein [Anaerolineales bacterium]